MITEKGKKYFQSTWTECDCHLGICMYNALVKLSREFINYAIGVVHRDYSTGIVRVATIYQDDVDDSDLIKLEERLEQLLKEEYVSSGFTGLSRNYKTNIYRYDQLSKYGYSDSDILYCFLGGCIFRKELRM